MDYVESGGGRKEHFISPAELSEKIRVLRKSSFVFENEYDYVGGIFELYQRIYQDDEEVMEISPVIILDRRSNGGLRLCEQRKKLI
jgi:ribosomal protein S24E